MRRKSRAAFIPEEYQCQICGLVFPVYRNSGKKRPQGHLKWLYCVGCKRKRNFIMKGG